MVVPLYIAEIAPTPSRGRLIGLNNMSITGHLVRTRRRIRARSLGVEIHGRSRSCPLDYPRLSAPLPSRVAATARIPLRKSLKQKLSSVVSTRAQQRTKSAKKVALIAAACDEAKELNQDASTWSKIKLLHMNPAYFCALVTACGLSVIAQMSGFNTLMYYSATLFALIGFDDPVAVGLVAGTNFGMTWVNTMAVHPIGWYLWALCVVCGVGYILIHLLYPEGSWLTLEEIREPLVQATTKPNNGFDVVVEATGNLNILNDSINYVRRGGKLLVYGVYADQDRVTWSPAQTFTNEITILSSFSQVHKFPTAIDYLESGQVTVDGIVNKTFRIEEWTECLDAVCNKTAIKAAIVFD
ncbi:MFS transporter [Aspergillus ustus]|uniref:MFS transporter n=1 Tax=Aspergillus ustus TaxID=40382 RepID=A0A0C1E1Z6_ASPUT|nr:MFS transporter [Aspergillus ustus]